MQSYWDSYVIRDGLINEGYRLVTMELLHPVPLVKRSACHAHCAFWLDYRSKSVTSRPQVTEEEAVPNYPYTSGQAALIQTFSQLRKGFPAKVDAGYLQRFNIAPANESYVISFLRFLGLIDDDGDRVEGKTDYFYGNDDSFKPGLEGALRSGLLSGVL